MTSAPSGQNAPRSFALRGRPHAIVLHEDGMTHPRSPRGGPGVFTPYGEITHLASSSRALWIGARRSVYLLSRRSFVDPNDPEHLVRELLARIAQHPGGSGQLARMAEIEESARMAGPLRATWGLALVCLLVFGLELLLGQNVHEVGYFSGVLVSDGDLWRVVTANLLHAAPGFPLHLALNLLALVGIGTLVERPLGPARTACVMGAAAVSSIAGSAALGEGPVVGASGIVFGLAAALVWLELRRADRLPAWLRVPRRTLLVFLGLNAGITLLVPFISTGAHFGGFFGGLLAILAVRTPGPRAERAPAWIRASGFAVVATLLLSVGAAGRALLDAEDFTAEHAARLARLPDVSPVELNDRAWVIAITPESTRAQIEAGLLLAERAVAETDRTNPNILDTLAELQFQLGQREDAIATIDEAIAKAPFAPYYREQRRRFTGERDAEDRPDPDDGWFGPPDLPLDPETAGRQI